MVSDTSTDTTQEALEISRLRYALRALCLDKTSGIASTDMGQHCVYCMERCEDYFVTLQHRSDCPIFAGQLLLGLVLSC